MKSLSSPVDKAPAPAQLFVCLSCWRQGEQPKNETSNPTHGKCLYEALVARLGEMGAAAPARAIPILCFANCERGCGVAIAGEGKWSYLLGGLGPEHADDLLTYAAAYNNARAGVVLPSKRPSSLEHAVIARFPAHLDPLKDAAE
jgi:predicted metal-binding protein